MRAMEQIRTGPSPLGFRGLLKWSCVLSFGRRKVAASVGSKTANLLGGPPSKEPYHVSHRMA